MNNSEEPNRNNLPPPVTVIVTLIVITIIVFPTVILAQWWLYYSSTVLLWDAAQTAMISYSGLAVILAFFIVLAMRRLSQSTKPEDIQRISGLVTEWTGWVILLLSCSPSLNHRAYCMSQGIFIFPSPLSA
jgi:Na+/H+ antiporter NhaA